MCSVAFLLALRFDSSAGVSGAGHLSSSLPVPQNGLHSFSDLLLDRLALVFSPGISGARCPPRKLILASVMWSVCLPQTQIGLFRSRAALQAEIFILRHQLNVLRRKSPKRLVFSNIDRLIFAGVYGLMPSVRNALKILKPETVFAWHRAGFRAY
jgi:hypothetical protein